MKWLDRLCFGIAGLCFAMAVFLYFYEPTLAVPKEINVGDVVADATEHRTLVLRNWAPWPIRILGGNFG